MTELDKVKHETVKFMRGKYRLDEVGNGTDQVKFRQGARTVLTILIRPDKYVFVVVFGKAERDIFESVRGDFSPYIQNLYDSTHTYHDGKWIAVDVTSLEVLEDVKRLIEIKKKPNRKPFSKENAMYSDCGMRCDLCVHYTGGTISEEFRNELKQRLTAVYKAGFWGDDMHLCPGCANNTFDDFGGDPCDQKKCCHKKGVAACTACGDYPCDKAAAGYMQLEPRSISADDVTWAILPYVPFQYGN